MILQNNTLQLDIKLTDAYRKYLSSLGSLEALKAGCVILGDSDIDYTLSPNISESAILNAPYAPSGIKHKLLWNGVGKDLSGTIRCFARQVQANGSINSLYNYPTDEIFSLGDTPPELINGKDWNQITFNDSKMGYILFFETVLDYYLTDDGINERLIELYDVSIDWNSENNNGDNSIPLDWDVVTDNLNGSMLISKNDTTLNPIGLNYRGQIIISAQFTKKKKIITFNF